MNEPSAVPAVMPRFPAADLRGFERVSVPLLSAWNRSRVAKMLVYAYVRYVSQSWIQAVIRNRLWARGLSHIEGMAPQRGVLLVSNHRTFWDMYVICSVLQAHTTFPARWYFPVRSRFFYSNPLGLLLNASVSGGAMWPPMFSGFGRQPLNEVSLLQCAHVLGEPGSVVGIHPEGTRNKAPDPLQFGNAKGGIGRVIKACHPDVLVVPVYLEGLTDHLPREIAQNFRGAGRRGKPIVVAWGEPVRAGDLQRHVPNVVLARELLGRVHALGEAAVAEAPANV